MRLWKIAACTGACGIALGLLVGAHLPEAVAAGGPEAQAAAGQFDRQPVLIYDVSGGTFGGTVHINLVVYTDGLVALSELTDFGGPPAEFNQTEVAVVDPETIDAFRIALGQAGAASLDDGVGQVADLPTTTVTYFRSPGTSVRANTFSYTGVGGPYVDVATVISEFIETHFSG